MITSVDRMTFGCATFAGIATLSATVLASQTVDTPTILIAGVAALMAAAVTFISIRRLVYPRMSRAEKAVARIEELIGDGERRQGDTNAVATAGDRDLLDRLEESAEDIAARLIELEKIGNYRQEFLSDVSHELQTPIFAVQGFAETLLNGALEDPVVNRPFVEKILRHAERLSTLVNDLSHISRIETGSVKMNLAPFDPRSLVNDAEDSLEITAASAGISLSKFVATDVRLVIGDRARIRQVLDNLISNGIKYNDEGGRVEITVRMTETGKVLFSVTDDGIGLADEHFARVTERFYRVDRSRSRDRGGTGLGLAIVKHILEAHGSRLTINSRVGRGSTFSFGLDSTPLHHTLPNDK